MAEHTNFGEFANYILGNDESELAKTKAELAYALHSLEREITICQHTQERNQELVRALVKVRSYNLSILAGHINYRPLDHVEAIDGVLGVVGGPSNG
jgi:hypothetical protein